MSRTHKIQRARQAYRESKRWRAAFNAALKLGYDQAQAHEEASLIQSEAQLLATSTELLRTSGVRYGNQRKMRSRCDVKARRADKRSLINPAYDIQGDLGLETRPPSPARTRGPRWT